MSKRSGIVLVTTTLTVTVFMAVAMVLTNPKNGDDSYSAQVLAAAKARQEVSMVTVPEPLKTDVVALKEEDVMAGKVSAILSSDDAFVAEIGDKAAPVVGEKISDLEETYSADMIARIDSSEADAKAYADEGVAGAKAYTDKEVAAAKAYADSKDKSDRQIAEFLLGDEAFMGSLTQTVGSQLSDEELVSVVLSSPEFTKALEDAMERYHEAHPTQSTVVEKTVVETAQTAPRDHITIPEFPVKEASEYTDEEYIEDRSEARLNEIDRILEFLGY